MYRQRQTVLILAGTLLAVLLINFSRQTLNEVPSLDQLPRPDFDIPFEFPDMDLPTNPEQTRLNIPDIEIGDVDPEPLLEILGRVNTEYLRLQTYADYFSGTWETALTDSITYNGTTLDLNIDLWTDSEFYNITITPLTDTGGYIPTPPNPLYLNLSDPAQFFEDSQIFQVPDVPGAYEIEGMLYSFSDAMKNASSVEPIPQYLDVPDYLDPDLKALAEAITQNTTTDYEAILALESYLENYYEYNLSCPAPPPGVDPLEYFLYESGEGVCIEFNTALTMLARSLDFSARLVGGYYVDPLADEQLVYPIQSHAFTEIPFEDLGWIIFDATPSAQILDMIGEIPEMNLTSTEGMFDDLNFTYPDDPFNIPQDRVFRVYGKTGSSYLRDGTGEYYNGSWYQPVGMPMQYTGQVIEATITGHDNSTEHSFIIEPSTAITGHLIGPQNPTQLNLDANATFYPEFKLFLPESPVSISYQVNSVEYTSAQVTLEAAEPYLAYPYLQIEDTLRDRIISLATQITVYQTSNYTKVQALAEYLRTEYTYNMTAAQAPEEVDPVVWFLFYEQGGICTDFASALTLMTRSIDLPARLVTGYLVNPDVEVQDVRPIQAHAYTEVLFDDLGWIIFDATPTSSPLVNITTGRTPTFTNITHQAETVNVGAEFIVAGTVIDENSTGVSGLHVLVYLKQDKAEPGVLSGQGVVTDGFFNITCVFPANLPGGEYMVDAHTVGDATYMDSWSDPPLTAFSETSFIIEAPEKVVSGQPYRVNVTLIDYNTNMTIPDAELTLTIDDGEHSLKTDDHGRVTLSTESDPGTVDITLRWEGSQYILGTENSTTIRSIPLQVVLPPETVLVRGERSIVRGQVRAEDIPGASEPISMALLEDHTNTVTNELGEFFVAKIIPASTDLGATPIILKVLSNGETRNDFATVKARTTLTLHTPGSGQAEAKTSVTIALLDDMGEPLGESPIEITYRYLNQTYTKTAITGSNGEAETEITLPDGPGKIDVKASYHGQGVMLPSSASKTVSVIDATRFPLFQLAAVILIIGGTAGLLYLRDQRRTSEIELEDMELVNQVQSDRLMIVLPDVEQGLPAVWGVNESMTIQGSMLDEEKEPSRGETLTLIFNETELLSTETDSEGKITHTEAFDTEGIHRLALIHAGEDLRTGLDIKIVDYREEIIRLFNNRFKEARTRFQSVKDNYTARELYEYLRKEAPEPCHEPLRELVFIFEEANYSLHEVNRGQYARFFKAMRKYKEALDGEDS